MARVESAQQRAQRVGGDGAGRHVHLAFVDLALIAHLDLAVQADAFRRETVGRQQLAAARFHVAEQLVQPRQVGVLVQAHHGAGQEVVFDVGDHLAEGAQAGRDLGHQHVAAADFLGQRGDVHARRAPAQTSAKSRGS